MADEQDPMPKQAAEAFDKAIALDAKDPRARYFVAVRKDLAGDHQGAVNDWLALLKDTPKGAPWENDLIRTIEQVGKINNIDVAARVKSAADGRLPSVALPAEVAASAPDSVAAAPIPGPSRADMAAAAKLPAGQQQEMVLSMVERTGGEACHEPRECRRLDHADAQPDDAGRNRQGTGGIQKSGGCEPGNKAAADFGSADIGRADRIGPAFLLGISIRLSPVTSLGHRPTFAEKAKVALATPHSAIAVSIAGMPPRLSSQPSDAEAAVLPRLMTAMKSVNWLAATAGAHNAIETAPAVTARSVFRHLNANMAMIRITPLDQNGLQCQHRLAP